LRCKPSPHVGGRKLQNLRSRALILRIHDPIPSILISRNAPDARFSTKIRKIGRKLQRKNPSDLYFVPFGQMLKKSAPATLIISQRKNLCRLLNMARRMQSLM
jgi:hypothetical protein